MDDILIFEPDLKDIGGHHLASAICIKQHLSSTNVEIYSHIDFPAKEAEGSKINRLFTDYKEGTNIIDKLCKIRYVWHLFKPYIYFREKKQIDSFIGNLKKQQFPKKNALWFFPSLSIFQMIGVINVAEEFNDPSCEFAVILRFPFGRKVIKKLAKRLEKSNEKNRIKLFSDSQLLIESFQNSGLKNVKLIPLPQVPDFNVSKFSPENALTLLYAGSARLEKGFDLLPQIISDIQADPEVNHHNFIIQSNTGAHVSTSERKQINNIINELEKYDVTLIQKALTLHKYHKLMNQSDILLFPYSNTMHMNNRYHATSGILAEALSLGKVVLVPNNTWLSEQVKNSKSGIVFNNVDELSEKVKECIIKFPELKNNAVDYSIKFKEFHNIKNFCKILLN